MIFNRFVSFCSRSVKPKCSLTRPDSTEDETVLQDQAIAVLPNHDNASSVPQSPTKTSEMTTPPDIIPETDKIRSSPSDATTASTVVTVTETKTFNHSPAEEKTTVVTTEEIVKDTSVEVHESVVVETKTEKVTQNVVTSKTVETIVVKNDEVRDIFS